MKRLLTLCIMLTAVALITAPAFAEVQNVKVSGDVNSAGVYRNNYNLFDNNNTNANGADDNFLFTQARVRIDADLTDNVSATVRFLTEYDWNTSANTSSTGDNVDLDLANVTLKEVFYQPLTVTVGRQELKYGNGFVIGDPDTNATSADGNLTATDLSLRKSFDAIKAVLDYNPLTVDVFCAKINETNKTGNDVDLYGINAAYDIGSYNSEVEAYCFLSKNDVSTAPTTATNAGNEIYTIGLRGSISPIDSLNLSGEVAFQSGDYDSESATKRDQKANAFQVTGDYTCPDVTIPGINATLKNPMLKLGYTHYSGEEVGNTGDHEAWIPLYEDQTQGIVANYILSGVNGGQNSNADILNVGGSLSPLQDLTLSIDFYKFWLDEKLVAGDNDQASTNSGLGWTNLATSSNYYMKADKDLGSEIDVALSYDYTEDVKMGLCAGWFKPGDAFDGASVNDYNDETATQVLATLDVSF